MRVFSHGAPIDMSRFRVPKVTIPPGVETSGARESQQNARTTALIIRAQDPIGWPLNLGSSDGRNINWNMFRFGSRGKAVQARVPESVGQLLDLQLPQAQKAGWELLRRQPEVTAVIDRVQGPIKQAAALAKRAGLTRETAGKIIRIIGL